MANILPVSDLRNYNEVLKKLPDWRAGVFDKKWQRAFCSA
mgnify:CR=1 FL=1